MLKYPYPFILIFMFMPFFGQAQISTIDSIELLEFAQKFGGLDSLNVPIANSWNSPLNLASTEVWTPNNPASNWYGVDTDASGNVIRIDLSGLPLSMPITSYSLADFLFLEEIYLDSCGLLGSFPVPMFQGGQQALRVVDISNNMLYYDTSFYSVNFSGQFGLEELYCYNTFVTPSALFSFYPASSQNLRILDISGNGFEGQLDMASAMSSLEVLKAKDNAFAGIINTSNATALDLLDISNNAMTTSTDIEELLENCPLSRLEASSVMNAVQGTTYPFPDPTPNFTPYDLHLDLSNNNFDGIANLDKLVDQTSALYINLSHNELDSVYPLQNSVNHLEYLDLSHNTIRCHLNNNFLTQYRGLRELRLNNNFFYGQISSFPDNTAEFIEVLDLSGNLGLVGIFPLEDFLTAQDLNAPLTTFDISNCNFRKLQPTSGNVRNFSNLKRVGIDGNRFHFDDFFTLVRAVNAPQFTVHNNLPAGVTAPVSHYIPPYWNSGAGAGLPFDTLAAFTYGTGIDSAGVGGVRRRGTGKYVYLPTNVGFDPNLVNTVRWFRTKGLTVESLGGLASDGTPQGFDNTIFPVTATDTGFLAGPDIDHPNILRVGPLDSAAHSAWKYFAEVRHDSFPLKGFFNRPKRLIVGNCFDSLGAPINCQQMLVQFQDTISAETKLALREELGVSLIDSCVCGSIELWEISDTSNQALVETVGTGTRGTVNTGRGQAELLSADPNYQLLGPGGNGSAAAPNFAPSHPNNNPVLIGMIDAGIDYNNSSLQERIWVNTEDNDNNGIDDDGDCEIDNGWGWNYLDRNGNVYDDHGHGTAVASVLGGFSSPNILPNSSSNDDIAIVPYKYTDGTGAGSVFEAACALRQASDYADVLPSGDTARIRVVNASWGYYGEPCILLENTIKYAGRKEHLLLVTSAGNDGYNTANQKHWPSNSPWQEDPQETFNDNVLAVASLNPNNPDFLASYSNYSAMHIDLAADGQVDAFVPGQTAMQSQSGTSFAAPQVARAAAQLFDEFPDASACAVRNALLLAATKLQSDDSLKLSSGGRLHYQDARQILYNTIDRQTCSDNYVLSQERIYDSAQEEERLLWLSPNPSQGQIHLQSLNGPLMLRILSLDGKVWQQLELQTSQTLDLSALPAGMYLIESRQNDRLQVQKWIKQ